MNESARARTADEITLLTFRDKEHAENRSWHLRTNAYRDVSFMRSPYLETSSFSARYAMKNADRIVAFGVTLLVVGVLIIVFDPVNLTIFITRLFGPTEPIGTVISLIGLSLTIAGGYRKIS